MANIIFESTFDGPEGLFWLRHKPTFIDGEIKMVVDRTFDFSPERADVNIGTTDQIPQTFFYGEEIWIGFRMRTPGWIPDNPGLSSLFFQLKPLWDSSNPNRRPFLIFYIREDKFLIVNRNIGEFENIVGSISDDPVDWIIRIKAHISDGYFELWRDGKLVRDFIGPTCQIERDYKIAFGPYIWYWKKGNESQPFNKDITQRVVYFDSMRVAQGADGYALVDPAQSEDPPPIPPPPVDHQEILDRLGTLEEDSKDLAMLQSRQSKRIEVVENLLKAIRDSITESLGD